MSSDNTTLQPESPLNQKDPVREQIEREVLKFFPIPDGSHPDSFIEDAKFLHGLGVRIALCQDRIATNRTVDAVSKMATEQQQWYDNEGWSALERLKKELEKLRK